ncbi:hypothetical protein RJ640_025966 [Escallonia rubra]|uniref:Uncharacterized protein n=1 Tax=Escallonia rubra TaxID=112253 RepID=A0AA88RJK0_9ASTE|nr:hypothetical protein RJ640_025966 [Escallonia rubra]
MENQVGLSKQRLGRRVVLFPVPLQGHINPMLQLASILHSRGFSIAIIHTRFNSPNPSKYPHFAFHSIDDGLLGSNASGEEIDNVLVLLRLINKNCTGSFRDCLTRLLSDGTKEPIACLITDAHLHFTQAIADSLKLPRIVLRTSNISSFLIFAAYPLLQEKGFISNQDPQSEAPLLDFPSVKVKDIPIIFTSNPEGLYEVIGTFIKQMKASSGIIWNTFSELEQSELVALAQHFPLPIFPIGPFHKYFTASSSSLLAQERSSISWLDLQKPKSVLYVSFGSIAAIDETDFIEMAWGLANSKQQFLWVVRPGTIRGSEWLEALPKWFLEAVGERGHIVKWAPQHEVLAHPATGAFWTHCGWNSTLESICEGVPMICSPSFGDQMVDARYVDGVWKIGMLLEDAMERGKIERAIQRVLVDKDGEEMRERIAVLKKKVNLCLKEGGSSYRSLGSLVSYILSF